MAALRLYFFRSVRARLAAMAYIQEETGANRPVLFGLKKTLKKVS